MIQKSGTEKMSFRLLKFIVVVFVLNWRPTFVKCRSCHRPADSPENSDPQGPCIVLAYVIPA